MSYLEHLRFAWSLAAASLIHGIFPMFFTDYVSNKIQERHEKLKACNIETCHSAVNTR